MSFSHGAPDRPDSFLFRPQPSPREEPPFPTFTSPLSPLRSLNSRVNSSNMPPATLVPSPDARGSLQRRFTTNAVPTLSPLAQQRRAAAEPHEYMSTAFNKITPSEKRARQYEELLVQQRRIQAEMALIDPETRLAVDEHQRLEQDINMFTSGHQSEPTTPPEHHRSAHRPNSSHFSSASLTSPPGIVSAHHRGGSLLLTSPSSTFANPVTSAQAASGIPSQSVPASRRGSDHGEQDYTYGFTDLGHRATPNLNRNSMPVKMADLSSMLGSVNTTGYLFGNEDVPTQAARQTQAQVQSKTASPESNTFLQLHTNNDKFPILVRREGDGKTQQQYSAGSGGLASSSDQPMTDRTTPGRNRQGLPPSAMRQSSYTGADAAMSPYNGALTDLDTAKNTATNRRSLEVKFAGLGEIKRPSLLASPKTGSQNGFKLQSSYSTNDIPTLKSVTSPYEVKPVTYASPEQNNAILSNLGASAGQQAQDVALTTQPEKQDGTSLVARSGLQASAVPFAAPVVTKEVNANPGVVAQPPMNPYGAPAYYGGYGMQMPTLNGGFANMVLGTAGMSQWPVASTAPGSHMAGFPGGYTGYNQMPSAGMPRYPDSQARVVQQRRHNQTINGNEENARFNNIKLETLSGEIYGLCKDQHGCRYLQKKLEERVPDQIELIFDETVPHVIELMTDPFGNYLCQKLLEYSNDDQRTALIRNAAPQMVKIALNQHGTRALQKMIEFVTTHEQIEIIIDALKDEVVPLIQDLNGNHVIQKCLTHLASEDLQFIFDAVGLHCVTVGTHRHGCCVLQRCIDHASGAQKGQLIQHITASAHTLVQDPFGNYVVQYILDLGEPAFSEPLCFGFAGSVAVLSKQKFSSNVIEKCIRTGSLEAKRVLVNEIMDPIDLEQLLRDSFANYVVQTAMDYADDETKARLIDNIRPILPAIRHTPYGRRIQGKIQDYDNGMGMGGGAPGNARIMPANLASPPAVLHGYTPPQQLTHGGYGRPTPTNAMSTFNSPNSNASNYGTTSPTPQRGMNSLNMMAQQQGQPQNGFPNNQGYPVPSYGRAGPPRSAGVSNY